MMSSRCIRTANFLEDLQKTLNELSKSIKCLIDMFCRTFHKEFRFKSFVATQKGDQYAAIMQHAICTLTFSNNLSTILRF